MLALPCLHYSLQINYVSETNLSLIESFPSSSTSTSAKDVVPSSLFAQMLGTTWAVFEQILSSSVLVFRLIAEPLLVLWNTRFFFRAGVALKDLSATGDQVIVEDDIHALTRSVCSTTARCSHGASLFLALSTLSYQRERARRHAIQ
jgi:hypothetical protein